MNVDNRVDLSQKVRAALADALQLPQEEITPDLAFGDLPQWDSMGHMEVMMRLEERFGVEINADTIGQLVSFPAITAYVGGRNHGDELNA
jgi:acyl carrier protein